MAGLLSNGVWTGVPLAAILKECGLKSEAREVVFLGADLKREEVPGRQPRVRRPTAAACTCRMRSIPTPCSPFT